MPGLAARLRTKYPGAYDDLTDAELEAKTLAKYPEYADLATPPPSPPPSPPQTRLDKLQGLGSALLKGGLEFYNKPLVQRALYGDKEITDAAGKKVPVLGGPGILADVATTPIASLGSLKTLTSRLFSHEASPMVETVGELTPRLAKDAPSAKFIPVASANKPRIPYSSPPTELETPVPKDWQSPQLQREPTPSTTPGSPQSVKEMVTDLRRAVGSEKAAARLNITPEAVKRIAPGPSHTPLAAEIGQLDADFKRHIADEGGQISLGMLRTLLGTGAGASVGYATTPDNENPLAGTVVGGAAGGLLMNPSAIKRAVPLALKLRMEGMLSGRSIPLNVATDVAAFGRAAVEHGSAAPLEELLRLPTNARNFARAFMDPYAGAMPIAQDIQQVGGRFVGPIGRTVNALDKTAVQGLERAQTPLADIQRYLHIKPRPPVWPGPEGQVASIAYPFQRTPINMVGGASADIRNLIEPGSWGRKLLTVGSIPYGMAVGKVAEDQRRRHPLATAILAPAALATMGPMTIPATIAAIASAPQAKAMFGSMGPLSDWSLDPKLFWRSWGGFKPSALGLYERYAK